MSERLDLLARLREEFQRWEDLLAGLTEDQITHQPSGSEWSTKDAVAHVGAWQQVSIARLEAAVLGNEPVFPGWLAGLDPEAEDHTEFFNTRILDASREPSWPHVRDSWQGGFMRFLELGEQIPDDIMLDPNRYPWLKGYPLSAVLQGSLEHHQEHREMIRGKRQNVSS